MNGTDKPLSESIHLCFWLAVKWRSAWLLLCILSLFMVFVRSIYGFWVNKVAQVWNPLRFSSFSEISDYVNIFLRWELSWKILPTIFIKFLWKFPEMASFKLFNILSLKSWQAFLNLISFPYSLSMSRILSHCALSHLNHLFFIVIVIFIVIIVKMFEKDGFIFLKQRASFVWWSGWISRCIAPRFIIMVIHCNQNFNQILRNFLNKSFRQSVSLIVMISIGKALLTTIINVDIKRKA